jgi:hypothetical protein
MANLLQHRSDPFHGPSSEQALRHGEQDEKDNDEGEGVLVCRTDVTNPQRFEQPEQQSARNSAKRIAHAAEHRGRKSLQRQQRTDIVTRERDRRDQDTGDRA